MILLRRNNGKVFELDSSFTTVEIRDNKSLLVAIVVQEGSSVTVFGIGTNELAAYSKLYNVELSTQL